MKRVLATCAVVGIAVGAFAGPAAADVDGTCEASVADVLVRGRSASDPADAIKIDADSIVRVGATSPGVIGGYVIEMEFAGVSWTVARGGLDGSEWSRDVRVEDYARFGVGVYRIRALSTGATPCTAEVLVRITGRHPLSTVAGVAAAALLVAGTTAAGRSARRSTRRPPEPAGGGDR